MTGGFPKTRKKIYAPPGVNFENWLSQTSIFDVTLQGVQAEGCCGQQTSWEVTGIGKGGGVSPFADLSDGSVM